MFVDLCCLLPHSLLFSRIVVASWHQRKFETETVKINKIISARWLMSIFLVVWW
jgi:branched-subunit amino acid permease